MYSHTHTPHAGHQQAASSVLYTTSCKQSLVLLRMGEIIAQNMLTWMKLLIKWLLLHLVVCLYYCINDASSHKHIYIHIYIVQINKKISLENSKLKNSRFGWGASQYLPVHLNYHPIIINSVLQLSSELVFSKQQAYPIVVVKYYECCVLCIYPLLFETDHELLSSVWILFEPHLFFYLLLASYSVCTTRFHPS